MVKTQRFKKYDMDVLIDSGEFYADMDGNKWEIKSEKNKKKVGSWNRNTNRLTINNKELTKWLKENSY